MVQKHQYPLLLPQRLLLLLLLLQLAVMAHANPCFNRTTCAECTSKTAIDSNCCWKDSSCFDRTWTPGTMNIRNGVYCGVCDAGSILVIVLPAVFGSLAVIGLVVFIVLRMKLRPRNQNQNQPHVPVDGRDSGMKGIAFGGNAQMNSVTPGYTTSGEHVHYHTRWVRFGGFNGTGVKNSGQLMVTDKYLIFEPHAKCIETCCFQISIEMSEIESFSTENWYNGERRAGMTWDIIHMNDGSRCGFQFRRNERDTILKAIQDVSSKRKEDMDKYGSGTVL